MSIVPSMTKSISAKFAGFESNLNYQYGLLAGITLLAIVLRFYKLGEWSFWIDEIFTIGRTQAHYSSLEATIHNIPPERNWLPLSVLFTASVLNVLGINEWSARLTSAIIGIISIPTLYFPIKKIFSIRLGLISALLLAVSPWHLAWSQNARFYTALMLFYTLALFAFYFGLERDRLQYIGLSILLFYLAMSERIFALFLVPVVLTYLVLLRILPFEKPPGFHRRNLLLLLLPVIAGGLIEGHSLITTGSSRLFADFGWFFLYRNYTPLRLMGVIGFDIGIPLMCLAAFGGIFLLSQKSRAGLLLFIGALLPLALLLPLSLFMFTQDRYMFLTLPSWILLAAVAVQEIWAQTQNSRMLLAIGVLVLLVADAAGDNVLYYRVNHGDRRDWRGAFTLIRDQSREGDAFVAYWPEFGPYYLNREITSWENIDPEAVVQSGKRFWFIIDSETVWGNLRMKQWVEQNAELIDIRYLRLPEDLSLRIYLYDPERDGGTQQADIGRH